MACSIRDCKLLLTPAGVLSGIGGGWLWTPIHTKATKGQLIKLLGTNFIKRTGQGFWMISSRTIIPSFEWGKS